MTEERPKAWQPFTFGGVARYGHDALGKLFVTCLFMALLTATIVTWTMSRTWAPVIEEAITRLPNAEIRSGKFTTPESLRLAENAYLSLWFETADEVSRTSGADIQVVFTPTHIRF